MSYNSRLSRWDELTRQEKEAYKLRQFAQYWRDERDGDDILIIIEKRDYWNIRKSIISEHTFRVLPNGKIVDEGHKDI